MTDEEVVRMVNLCDLATVMARLPSLMATLPVVRIQPEEGCDYLTKPEFIMPGQYDGGVICLPGEFGLMPRDDGPCQRIVICEPEGDQCERP